jgi:hypothetical protein
LYLIICGSMILTPINPQINPIAEPCPSYVVARDPFRSNSTSTFPFPGGHICLMISPIRWEAAVWELDGPLISGPITSLKILGFILLQHNNVFLLCHYQFRNRFRVIAKQYNISPIYHPESGLISRISPLFP